MMVVSVRITYPMRPGATGAPGAPEGPAGPGTPEGPDGPGEPARPAAPTGPDGPGRPGRPSRFQDNGVSVPSHSVSELSSTRTCPLGETHAWMTPEVSG